MLKITILKKSPMPYLFMVYREMYLTDLSSYPTVFYEDEENGIFVGAIPDRPEFGYFGYLKKMILTLHNSIIMKIRQYAFSWSNGQDTSPGKQGSNNTDDGRYRCR
ncbi:MAG: hypothetical protein MZV63_45830 [Marinilabiliales bacterium]|nr:hypothetical protein [Marinilabiliales bacterium]